MGVRGRSEASAHELPSDHDDALVDGVEEVRLRLGHILLPDVHGFGPTVRIADFEVEPWIWGPRAASRMATLIEDRLAAATTEQRR